MSTTVEEIKKVETGENIKSGLLLDSLEIKGYRCFEHLTIEEFGRVNLIVGKNNVGKTALLEAILIYINKGNIQQLLSLLESRDEAQRIIEQPSNKLVIVNLSFKSIFTLSNDQNASNPNELKMKGSYKGEVGTLAISFSELLSKDGKRTNIAIELSKDSKMFSDDEGSVVEIRYTREKSPAEFDLEYFIPLENKWILKRKNFQSVPNVFIRAESLKSNQLLLLWDETNKNNLERYVISAMQILEGSIKDVSFVGIPSGSSNLIPHVVVADKPIKLPLKRFGDGMTRILGLSLALSNCRDGVLFIDEIESGLHYSILPAVWKLIFKLAEELNLQVFATTHSKDCVEAFAQAAIDDEESDGMLIRLERHGEKIVAKTISEERLADAVDYEVEVR